MRLYLILAAVGLLAAACDSSESSTTGDETAVDSVHLSADGRRLKPFVKPIEAAHKAAEWRDYPAMTYDIYVEFGGKARLEGKTTVLTDNGRVRIDLTNGATMYFNGKDAYIAPASSERKRVRFDVLTWSYFLLAPTKLSDPGVNLESNGTALLNGDKPYDIALMTFDAGVGDAPDDWYVLYRNKQTNRLDAMAYIVTYGDQSQDKAEEDPHAIVYNKYDDFQGIPVATEWLFYGWRDHKLTEQLGSVRVSNVRFLESIELDAFTPPEDARLEPLPGK